MPKAGNAVTQPTVDINALDKMTTPDAIREYFAGIGVDVTDNDADGIKALDVVKDKKTLEGVPFLITIWSFHEGDYRDDEGNLTEYVAAEIMLEDGTRLVLVDGSTGICRQLRELADHRRSTGHPAPMAGRFVRKGLRRSDYTFTDLKGRETPATTHYLDY